MHHPGRDPPALAAFNPDQTIPFIVSNVRESNDNERYYRLTEGEAGR
jgi:hypothetical protein